jgi:hypothetical protein
MIKEQIIVTEPHFLYTAANPMGTMLDNLYIAANPMDTMLDYLYTVANLTSTEQHLWSLRCANPQRLLV